MLIPVPAHRRLDLNRRGLQLFAVLGGLLALLLLLGGVAEAAAAGRGARGPVAQQGEPRGAADTGEQRSVKAYLESKGYTVLGVGYPTDENDDIVEGWVAVAMPLASASFDPRTGLVQDEDTIKQVLYGFYALRRYYSDYPNLAVMLEWREYLLWFPVSAESFQTWLDEELDGETLWGEVMDGFAAYNTETGEEADARNFTNKDFNKNPEDDVLPPVDPNSGVNNGATSDPEGPLRLRLQPSSAYLPTDGDIIRLIATVNDAQNRRVSDRNVQFVGATTGEDPQDLGTARTGVDGVARVDLRGGQASGPVSIGAQPDISDIDNQGDQLGAGAIVLVGPAPRDGNGRAAAVRDGLITYGYEVGETGARNVEGTGGSRSAFGYAIARMASARFDDRVRTQILTSFGTIFRVYPSDVASARVGLIYPSGGRQFLLLYLLNRGDWQSFVQGELDEGRLWQAIGLYILDAQTGEPVDQKDFTDKNFIGGTSEDTVQRGVEARLVTESWGDQLYSAQISIPLGSYVDGFRVADRQGNGVFAIYLASNPTTPIYSSADDRNGSRLASLRLGRGNREYPEGEYMLTISGGDPPTSIRVTYVEHTVR